MVSKIPKNFSWIEEGKLAAFGCPSTAASIQYLLENNITYLVTLSPETPPPIHTFPDINWVEIKVREFYPPTNYQIEKFINTCEKAFSENKVCNFLISVMRKSRHAKIVNMNKILYNIFLNSF